MSRIGRLPITVPAGVTVNIKGNEVAVKGPKGTLTRSLHPDMAIALKDGSIVVSRPSDGELHRSLHGLTRTLLANMIEGVTKGFQKNLEISGVGYRAQMAGKKLVIQAGYSHPVEIEPPAGIQFAVDGQTKIAVQGIDKELVGEVAAQVRRVRKPEPYKGKGIAYAGEHIRRKAGKTGKTAAKK
jgi:large subunit ribosomal protein L6